MDSNFEDVSFHWGAYNQELFSPPDDLEQFLNLDIDMETPNFLRAAAPNQPSASPPKPAPEPENGNRSDSSLPDAPDVVSPSQVLTPPTRASPKPQEPLVDEAIPAHEQAALPPAMQPGVPAYPPMYPNNAPPYGNWYSTLPNGQPLYPNVNPPYGQSPPPSMPPPVAPGQNSQGPMYGQPQAAMAPYGFPPQYYNQPNQRFPNSGGQGEFANQPNNPIQRDVEPNNNEAEPQDVTMHDVVAEVGKGIGYVSAGGDVFTGNDVRYNPTRGYFLPLVQRRQSEVPKRSGPRPGTQNEPLYDMCMWTRGVKSEDSDCLGINVYGRVFDRPDDWELPNGLGKIRYNSEGCMPDSFTLSARQIRAYINHNPRKLRLMVANPPSQATHRLMAKECIWNCCPNAKHNMRQGFQQVIFDEYPEQTDIGDRDPFRIAGRMHLWCYEQCFDIVEDFKQGIVKPETRSLLREQKNAMALDRDCNTTIERETYEPWFRHQIQTANGPLSEARPYDQSLACVLTKHHLLSQAKRRQEVRDLRNNARDKDPKSMDVHEGDLYVYHQRARKVASDYYESLLRPDEAFQPSPGHPDYRLPDYFGSRAVGKGFVLDKSLIQATAQKPNRKRGRAEVTPDEDEGGDNPVGDDVEDERPQRPIKRARMAASPIHTPSPRRTHVTPNEDGDGESLFGESPVGDDVEDERPERPNKRARTGNSLTHSPPPNHTYATRANSPGLMLPGN